MSLRSTTGSMALRCALACNGDVTELSAHVCRTTCEKVPKPRTLFLFRHPSSKVFFRRAAEKRSFSKSPMLQVFVLFRTKTNLRGCGGHGGWRAWARIQAQRFIKWWEWRISRRRLARSGHQCAQSQQVGDHNSAISGLNRLNLVSEFNYSAWMRTQDLLTSFYFLST